jgi:FAD/FMN-containing dehydrogenase
MPGLIDRRRFLRLAGSAAAMVGPGSALALTLASAGCTTPARHPAARASSSTTSAPPDWAMLARTLSGNLVFRSDTGYDIDKLLYNERFDGIHPAAIAYCRSVGDVQRCIEFAREADVRAVARSGGHSYGGYSLCEGLVVDVTNMSGTIVDPGSSTASVGAGSRLIDIYGTVSSAGFLLPGGSCPTVGIAGLALGGGIGVVGRNYGLTCDNIASLRIVTADGTALVCGPDQNDDLYWACRGGGGGNFGIVTSFVFDVHPIPAISLFTLEWPWADAAQVLGSWLEWIGTTPDALWSNCQLSSAGSSGLGVKVTGVFCGQPPTLSPILQDLGTSIGSAPTYSFVGPEDYMSAMLIEAGCEGSTVAQCHLQSQNPAGVLSRSAFSAKSAFLTSPMPDAGLSAVVDDVESLDQSDPTVGGGFVFDSFGGAIGRVPPQSTAFAHRDAIASIEYSFSWSPGAPSDVVDGGTSWLEATEDSLEPYVDGAYVNYIDPTLADWQSAYYGSNLERLTQVKRKYDPDDFFRFAQSIPLAHSGLARRAGVR